MGSNSHVFARPGEQAAIVSLPVLAYKLFELDNAVFYDNHLLCLGLLSAMLQARFLIARGRPLLRARLIEKLSPNGCVETVTCYMA